MVKATFTDIVGITSAEFSLGIGPEPSVCRLTYIPQEISPPLEGTLVFDDGSTSVTFNNCRVDSSTFHQQNRGIYSEIRILDRRWKWKYGHVTADYNRRRLDMSLETSTVRSARDIASDCLTAMGESGFDVSTLPSSDYPFLRFTLEPAITALIRVCHRYGCTVTLDPATDAAKVVRIGVGANLPDGGERVKSSSVDETEGPSALLLSGEADQFQSKLLLEAVGFDPATDDYEPIDTLSYAPLSGWGGTIDPTNLIPDGSDVDRVAATATVFRYYRIKEQAGGGVAIPLITNSNPTPADIRQFLPLIPSRLEIDSATYRPIGKPARVEGVFATQQGLQVENTEQSEELTTPFSIDVSRGIVRFSQPVVKLNSTSGFDSADLALECSYRVYALGGYAPYRTTRRVIMTNNVTPDMPVYRPEFSRRFIVSYSSGSPRTPVSAADSYATLQTAYQDIADAMSPQFFSDSSEVRQYVGVKVIAPDGAIRQVSWKYSRAGLVTTAFRNSELRPKAARLAEEYSRVLAMSPIRSEVDRAVSAQYERAE